VPRPDPIPSSAAPIARRFWRILRLLALLSAVVAAIAVLMVARSAGESHPHLLVATALGIFGTMLVGTGLMTLVFLSASSGHDEAAGETHQDDLQRRDDE